MPPPLAYVSQVTIPLPSDEEVRKIVGEDYDPATMLNVFKMFAGTGNLYAPTIAFVRAIFKAEGISPKIREMIILRAAKVLDSPYEWQANAVLARNIGLSDDEIAAVGSGGPVEGINPQYVLVCKATDELSKTGTLRDGTLAELIRSFGIDVCRRLILMISWFNLLSRFNNGCRVPLETTDKIGSNTSPIG
jgi:alkylhydroperoxidase family enzyme